MLTSIVRATKTHYAALQHRASPDREKLSYTVTIRSSFAPTRYEGGSIMVKTKNPSGLINNGKRKREITKLYNRLKCMYPEANYIDVSF